MTKISSWSFDNDPHILAEKEHALTLARQQATTQRQSWEQGLRIQQTNLDSLNIDAQIARETVQGKRPLLEIARLKSQTNSEKLTQARLNLQSAQLSTSIARDTYQGLVGERSIRQKLIGQKLRNLSLQAEQLRASTDAQHRSLSAELGALPLPTVSAQP